MAERCGAGPYCSTGIPGCRGCRASVIYKAGREAERADVVAGLRTELRKLSALEDKGCSNVCHLLTLYIEAVDNGVHLRSIDELIAAGAHVHGEGDGDGV